LARHQVEFILVGGAAAVLQGAPVVTFDVDIVHRRTPENIERLLSALRELEATYRYDNRGLTPQASHLESAGHQLLTTRWGSLDVLGSIEDGTTYEQLFPATQEAELRGQRVRVLTLERLIESKRRVDRPKDRLMLDILLAVQDEQRKLAGGSGA
jgi:hypothetical protein